MWVKGIFLITFALFIDVAQIIVGWIFIAVGLGLQFITPVGGGVGGAAAGAYLCWDSSAGVIAGVIASVKCAIGGGAVGALASAFGTQIGMGMGFVVDISISLTMGGALILAMIMCGMFYPKYVWSGSIVEFLPFFDMIPGWTAMVILSIMEKSKQEGGALGAAAGVALAVQSPSFKNITSAVSGVKNTATAMQSRLTPENDNTEEPQARTPSVLPTKNIDGIRPANDNFKSYVQKAA